MRPKRKKPPSLGGRARKDRIMVEARKVAKAGGCVSFKDVAAKLGDDGKHLRIWASAADQDELERLCAAARVNLPRRR